MPFCWRFVVYSGCQSRQREGARVERVTLSTPAPSRRLLCLKVCVCMCVYVHVWSPLDEGAEVDFYSVEGVCCRRYNLVLPSQKFVILKL